MSEIFDHGIFWFRRDLRIADNVGLAQATQACRKITPVFIFDKTILEKLEDKDDRRVTFIMESLEDLQEKFKKLGSGVIIQYGDPVDLIPKIAQKLSAQAVFCNRDFEPSAKVRDSQVQAKLKKQNIDFRNFVDQVIFAEKQILTAQGTPYRVFTPYKRAWLAQFSHDLLEPKKLNQKKFTPLNEISGHIKVSNVRDLGFVPTENIILGGSVSALQMLATFRSEMKNYQSNRNFPAQPGTSKLSAHLRFGTISIRHLVRESLSQKTKGHETWLSELIWRDFYQMILDQFPDTVNHPFQTKYKNLRWPGKKAHFEAWCEGQTGFPIIDAAMRCLAQTGWMHNRLRMIVASFLTKDLLIDWREGERFFARYLLDFDLAANVGGWQWAASTGCDAQPYFRVFNPATQSKRFDPKGEFIRSWIPELSDMPDNEIHSPATKHPDLFTKSSFAIYPAPIVHHDEQRRKALALFKDI